MGHWVRPHTPSTGGPGSIRGQRTRPHMPQIKILIASTKTRHRQINLSFKKFLLHHMRKPHLWWSLIFLQWLTIRLPAPRAWREPNGITAAVPRCLFMFDPLDYHLQWAGAATPCLLGWHLELCPASLGSALGGFQQPSSQALCQWKGRVRRPSG